MATPRKNATGPAAAKRGVHQYNLADYKNKKREEGSIEITGDDGEIYKIDPPELWPDEIAEVAASDDNFAAAQLLLGVDVYDKFVTTGGGSANLLMSIIAEAHGLTVGESPAS